MIFSINKYNLRQTFAPHTFSSKHSFKHQEGKTNSMTSLSAFHNFCVHFSCFIFPHPGSKAKQEKALASNHSNFLNSRELLSKPRIHLLLEHLYQITALPCSLLHRGLQSAAAPTQKLEKNVLGSYCFSIYCH